MVNSFAEVCSFLIDTHTKVPSKSGDQEIAFTDMKRISISFVLVEMVTKTILRYCDVYFLLMKLKRIWKFVLVRV